MLLTGILSGCEQKAGTILHKVRFTVSDPALKSASAGTDDRYTGFGIYITSITPYHFSAKMNILCYQDNWDLTASSTHIISYIDGHDNDPQYEIALYADFSGNQEVAITPILYSTDIWDGIFKQTEVTFAYFNFVPYYFYQELELPGQYKDLMLENLGGEADYAYDPVTDKVVLKVNSPPFISPLFRETGRIPFGIVFGNTDSTYLFNPEGETIYPSENFPFGGSANSPVVRSNNYVPLTVRMPLDGETIEMYSTISFDTGNLIQVYSGQDNVPYTADDVFLYAPKYWERILVKLEIN